MQLKQFIKFKSTRNNARKPLVLIKRTNQILRIYTAFTTLLDINNS